MENFTSIIISFLLRKSLIDRLIMNIIGMKFSLQKVLKHLKAVPQKKIIPYLCIITCRSITSLPVLLWGKLSLKCDEFHRWLQPALPQGKCRHCFLDQGTKFSHCKQRDQTDFHWQKHIYPKTESKKWYILIKVI